MKIGDKVRFLNDVGGGKITGFRQGGIVLVEDEDGFAVPMPQHEVVVIEEDTTKVEKKPASPKMMAGAQSGQSEPATERNEKSKKEESQSLNGKEYLQSKTVVPAEEDVVDEQLEARVTHLEMTIQKLEARIALLEAENNLRKNECMMPHKVKSQPKKKPDTPKTIGDLQIL